MRKILWVLLIGVLLAAGYYLFIRPFEYEVKFQAKTSPGDIIESIRVWDRSLKNATVLSVDSFSMLSQHIVWQNRSYLYNWYFASINDSITNVSIQISEPGRGFINKLLIPFTNQAIEQDASDIGNKFYNILKEHLTITKVKIMGESEMDSSFCVCKFLKTSQVGKANGMMRDFPLLTTFIADLKLKPNGKPIIRVLEWNHSKGLLKFDFCFPIARQESLPVSDSIQYKEFKVERALKAEYHGNYITSDRAWYELIQYAERNGYKTSGLPIEYFHDNPNLGSSEMKWKAEVFLPILEEN